MEKLALARLPDDYMNKQLTDNVYNNSNLVVAALKELYQLDYSVFVEDYPTLANVEALTATTFDRTVYLWLNARFLELENLINSLITQFNEHGIVDITTGEDTAPISLWIPQALAMTTDYKNNINNNWQLIENKINGLLLYYNNLFSKEEA